MDVIIQQASKILDVSIAAPDLKKLAGSLYPRIPRFFMNFDPDQVDPENYAFN